MSVMFLSVTLISLSPYFSPFFKSSSLSRKLDKIHDLLLKKAFSCIIVSRNCQSKLDMCKIYKTSSHFLDELRLDVNTIAY